MTTIADELVIEGIAKAFGAFLDKPEIGERLIAKMAELRSELMTTQEAADMLRIAPKTLRANHVEWKIDKSVALGPDEPRWYRAQIMARVRAKEVKGSAPQNVTEFPNSTQVLPPRRQDAKEGAKAG